MGIQIGTLYKYQDRIRKKLCIHTTTEIISHFGGKSENLILTPRGQQVFQLYLKGYTDEEIGQMLGMGYSGVRRHKEKMREVNSCDTMRELAARFYSMTDAFEEAGNES